MKHFYLVENVTMKKLAISLEKHAVPGYSIVRYFIALPVLCTLLKLNWFMQSSSLLVYYAASMGITSEDEG